MSITSLGVGSGLDLNGILDQLRDAEREKLQPIERQLGGEQSRISAFGQIQGGLSELQGAASALSSPDLYQNLSASTRGDAVSAAADDTAVAGRYGVEVSTLATRGTLASQGQPDAKAAISGAEDQTMTLTFGDTSTHPVSISAESSLEDIRDAINADDQAGVDASVIFDGSNYRLALGSTETGADASIASFSFDRTTPLAQDDGTAAPGTDAALSVNGVDITSANNQVEGAIQGVTLNLDATGTAQVEVEQDTLGVREAITGLVDAFNAYQGTAGELTRFNSETGEAGELNGDAALRRVDSRLRNDIGGVVESAPDGFSTLRDIGIALELDGTLSIDEARLDSVISNDQQALSRFLAGDETRPGLADQISTSLDQMLANNGAVQGAINSSETRIESLESRFTRTEQQVEQTLDRYRTQFNQLDGMIAEMNQTSDYLTQQFASLDAQLGR